MPENAKQMADFMRYVNSKIAKEAGRMHHWREKLWGQRYTDVPVSHEPEAQVSRLALPLGTRLQGRSRLLPETLAGSQLHRRHSPGAAPIEGIWIDRTQQHRARERNKPTADNLFTSTRAPRALTIYRAGRTSWKPSTRPRYRRMVREIEESMEGVSSPRQTQPFSRKTPTIDRRPWPGVLRRRDSTPSRRRSEEHSNGPTNSSRASTGRQPKISGSERPTSASRPGLSPDRDCLFR